MAFLTRIFEQLLSMALTALPVMAVVLLVRLLLRKAPKKYSYALWLVVAFRLVCPVAISTDVSIIPQELSSGTMVAEWKDTYTEDTWVIPADSVYYDAAVTAGRQPVTNESGQTYVVAAEDQLREPDTVFGSVIPVASVIWLLGLMVSLGYILWSVFRLRKQVATAVRREWNVWECDGIPTPFVLGLFWTRIYIPFHLSEEERAYVLAHEQYHIRHLDHWAKALALGILAVYWWNPAVWLCWVLFCRDMEMRCDEAVLAKLGEDVKRGYSLSLVSFALDRRFPMALAFGEHDAAKRVKNVLKWKKAKPIVLVIGTVVVIAVAVVCGTNTSTASRVTTEMDGDGVHITAKFKDSVKSWAIYEDVYQDGRLIYSKPRLMDGFEEDGTGTTPRKFEGVLRVDAVHQEGLVFVNELACSFETGAIANWTLPLPEDEYTGMASVLGNGDLDTASHKRYSIEAGEEVLLYSVLLATNPNGSNTTYYQSRSLPKVNDVVVQYRLVASTGTAESFEDTALDLAQTLYDLRVETLNDPEDPGGLNAIRALLDAMGVGKMGEYELGLYDADDGMSSLGAVLTDTLWTGGIYDGESGLLIRFLEPEDKEKSNGKWELIGYLIQALIPDLEDGDYVFPKQPGGNEYHQIFMDGDDWIAEHLGYKTLKELGQSAKGIRALLAYFAEQEDPLGDLARELFSLRADGVREQPAVAQMMEVMDLGGEPLGTYTVTWPEETVVQVDFTQLNVTTDDLDSAMTSRAAMILAVSDEVEQVNWCSIPDSNYTVYFDRAQPDAWARNLGYENLADLGRTIEGLEKFLKYLGFDETGLSTSLLSLAGGGDRWELMEALMEADLWDGAITQSAQVTTTANFDVTVVFERPPQDAEALDIAMTRRAMVLLKLRPTEINRVCWSYPNEDGGIEQRVLHVDEMAGLIALSSDSRVYQSIETVEDLERFIRFLNLDKKVFLMFAGEENSLAAEEPALLVTSAENQIGAAWYEDGSFDWNYDGLPTLILPAVTTPSHTDPYILTLSLSGDEAETLTAGEDYYAVTENGTTVEKNTYTLPRNEDGVYRLTIQRRNEDQAEQAVYFVPYEKGKFVFRVQLPQRISLPENSTPFTDILGYDGYIQTESTGGYWEVRTYYAVTGSEIFPIAESFGFDGAKDYSVDLDGDGVKEFVTNVQFGGDGHENVYVYRRIGDGASGIQRGILDLSDLPNHDNWGVNSTTAEYDPAAEVFRIRYAQKNTEEYGVLETQGLERFQFSEFSPMT